MFPSLPPELERELTVIEFALPGKEELRAVLGGVMESANIKSIEAEIQEKVIDAASGLTTIEAENAFALSLVQSKAIIFDAAFSSNGEDPSHPLLPPLTSLRSGLTH